METLPKGTKEYLFIEVTDKFGALTTLDGLSLTWSVEKDDDPETPVGSGVALHDAMTIWCGPLDTSGWDEDVYNLFATVDLPPELIKLGPFKFSLD